MQRMLAIGRGDGAPAGFDEDAIAHSGGNSVHDLRFIIIVIDGQTKGTVAPGLIRGNTTK